MCRIKKLLRYVHLPFLATLRSIKIAIFGNFLVSIFTD